MSSTDSAGVLHHHFDNIEQQKGTHLLGMWAFLVTEAMFFGGVIAAYTAYRIWYPRDFEAASHKLNVLIATINSLLLLTSSFTITMAMHAAQRCDKHKLKLYLLITAILGIAFLGFKAREYYNDFEEHLIPGRMFDEHEFSVSQGPHESDKQYAERLEEFNKANIKLSEINPKRVQLFFMFYYSMTGLHVLHMIIGIAIILWLFHLARKDFFHHPDRATSIEVISLYWHFVDMVWFFLVAILYCAGPHTSAQLHL
jgi:cytochrome c oxidase subunit 3